MSTSPHIATDKWRQRLAGAFQDFYRFELHAQQTVGVGDLPRVEDRPATQSAVDRAGAHDVIERLAYGLETQLGPSWDEGAEVSFGQWQKLALARGFMRDAPLAADPRRADRGARCRDRARAVRAVRRGSRAARRHGRVTVLVSHRFSTVRMADLIVVMDGAHVVESGSHEELHGSQRSVRRAVPHPGRRLLLTGPVH